MDPLQVLTVDSAIADLHVQGVCIDTPGQGVVGSPCRAFFIEGRTIDLLIGGLQQTRNGKGLRGV